MPHPSAVRKDYRVGTARCATSAE